MIGTLEVEAGRLMHTSPIYEVLAYGLDPKKIERWMGIQESTHLYPVGVCTRDFPESNNAIMYYAHEGSLSPTNRTTAIAWPVFASVTRHKGTVIYKKGAHDALGFTENQTKGHNVVKMSGRRPYLEPMYVNGKLLFNFFSTIGLVAEDSRQLFDTDNIEGIICYTKQDAQDFKKVLSGKDLPWSLFLQEENPQFLEEFAGLFENNGQYIDLTPIITLLVPYDQDSYECNRDILKAIKNKARSNKIGFFNKNQEESFKRLLSIITREEGLPRWIYVKQNIT